MYARDGSTWTQQAKLTASDAASGDGYDKFGGATNSVGLSGDWIVIGVVGAQFEDSAHDTSGAAYVYLRSGTDWTSTQKLKAADAANDDRFGRSVGISGNYIAIGAVNEDAGGSNAGVVYIFNNKS